MKAALRVLTALSERQEPEQADVDELHWYAPAERARPLDELVCDAIQLALKDREQSRQAVKATLRQRTLTMTPMERLVLENAYRRQEYGEVCARLKRLGMALQNAAAADGPEIDGEGIVHLLHEHARLKKALLADQEVLKAQRAR
ncbi:MAG TPA: hypothetical protein VHW09_06460 [Bryobacteraceae bacterium]|nr:hypothetical protein [Bryobacteraceae bacterium]